MTNNHTVEVLTTKVTYNGQSIRVDYNPRENHNGKADRTPYAFRYEVPVVSRVSYSRYDANAPLGNFNGDARYETLRQAQDAALRVLKALETYATLVRQADQSLAAELTEIVS